MMIRTDRKNDSYWKSVALGVLLPIIHLPEAMWYEVFKSPLIGIWDMFAGTATLMFRMMTMAVWGLSGYATLMTKEEREAVMNSDDGGVQ